MLVRVRIQNDDFTLPKYTFFNTQQVSICGGWLAMARQEAVMSLYVASLLVVGRR